MPRIRQPRAEKLTIKAPVPNPALKPLLCRPAPEFGVKVIGDMQIPVVKVLAGVPAIGHSSLQAVHVGRPMFSGRGESPHRR